MNDRIKLLRKTIGYSQRDFGKKLGVGDTAISKLEKGERNLTDQMAKAICREFNVNYAWLLEGKGDMFSALPETLLDELAEEYELDELDLLLVKKYLQLPAQKRATIKDYLVEVFVEKKDDF